MKFSRKYTRKHKRNGKTKKSKKGGKVPRPISTPFPIDSKKKSILRPRTPTPPHNRINIRTPPRRTRPQNNIVRDQDRDTEYLLSITG